MYVQVTVGTMSSMHFLMKLVNEVVYSSMPFDEYWNIFLPLQAVLQLTTSVLSESLVLPALVLACRQESG